MSLCRWVALLVLCVSGCEPAPPVAGAEAGPIDAGEPPVDGRTVDRDAHADALPDAIADATSSDVRVSDAMPDAMPDAAHAMDAMPDAIADAVADAMPDAMRDAMPDVMALDAAPPDDGVDRGVPIWDAAIDAEVDLAVDAAPDRALDAEPDMMPFDGPARSDDFESAPLADFWQIFNPQLFAREVRDGALWLTPQGFGLWFDRNTGPMVHQAVSGDFRVSARVRARRASAPDEPPPQVVHLGGLIARDPRSPPENYLFIVVGRDVNDLSVETKTTEGGRSVFEGPAWPHGSDAELRLCRLGADFHMYKRPIEGGAWELAGRFERPDLPQTLQVGAIAYTNSAQPDLTVGFEEIVFADVFGEDDCLADDVE